VISAGLLTLHDQPEQLAVLRAGVNLDHVADELLRHAASLQFVNRMALEDVPIDDHVIPAGATVFVMIAAANRDPAVFPNPDRLDFTRPRPKHLTFGGGIHHCLGAALARLELEVLLEQLAARFSRVDLTGMRPEFRDSLAFRSLESLPAALRSPGGPSACPVAHESDDIGSRVAILETQPLFSAFRPSELVALAQSASLLTFAEGEVLVQQGAPSDSAYVMLEGTADVLIDDVRVGSLGQDDLVGERGVVTGTPRAATVRATSHVAAYRLSLERLGGMLDVNAAASPTMQAVTAARYPANPSR
jgi:hypothetical protein